jgi:hypothetical protein
MKRILTAVCLCLSFLVIGANGQKSDGPLTNAAVIKLVKAGFKEKTVIAIIGSQPTNFNLDTEQLINLKRNGVNENIILAMLSAHLGTVVVGDDDWSSAQFFKESKRSNDADSTDQGTGIFGSGSSSRSSSRSRGGLGGNENEGNVSGSATVRIIKPPVEGGEGAAPKLEKTPTLTNEGVVRLVDAGFSEGTIIKRIEQSPVDFDLSHAKVVELQKKRVSEAIIAAMNAAMGK